MTSAHLRTHKRCCRCKEERLVSEFYKRAKGGYLSPNCKVCTLLEQGEEYRKDGDKQRARGRARYLKNKDKTRGMRPELTIWNAAKCRAKKKNVPFNLEVSDVVIPSNCPVLGIPLFRGTGKHSYNSPSIDRILPELGYVKGNIAIISMRANWVKRDSSRDEIVKILTYMKEHRATGDKENPDV